MKKALVIGASSGIGRALAELMLHKNFTVGMAARRTGMLEELKKKYPGKVFSGYLDVRDTGTVEAACDKLVAEMGGLDIMIISAGTGDENSELDFAIEDSVIRTNILGFTCLADWGLRCFKKQGYGHLVNISSVAGIRGNGSAPSYNATKAYQINYLEGLRLNAGKMRSFIFVTDVRPGFVNTAMAKGEGLFWVAPAEKAAKQIFAAIMKRRRVVYVTKRWSVIGFLLKILPYPVLRRLS